MSCGGPENLSTQTIAPPASAIDLLQDEISPSQLRSPLPPNVCRAEKRLQREHPQRLQLSKINDPLRTAIGQPPNNVRLPPNWFLTSLQYTYTTEGKDDLPLFPPDIIVDTSAALLPGERNSVALQERSITLTAARWRTRWGSHL